jgi:hypothetical protein
MMCLGILFIFAVDCRLKGAVAEPNGWKLKERKSNCIAQG